MAYTNFQHCTRQQYEQIIYSGGAINKINISFNGTPLANADNYCEKLTRVSRILPNDGSKRLTLDNFVAQEITLILHDVDINTIQDPVNISIGTLVDKQNNIYEDVPLGVFNIQDTPTTDKNKITLKLRDNRVKFDFGYNAKPLIDAGGGTATKKQILNDICTQAGVTNDVTTFANENDPIGIYDSTINGSTYVAYLAEQAGVMSTITRDGHLKFVDLSNLTTLRIPLSIVEKYEIGEQFEIERVVYEAGAIKYQSSADETLQTLFLNGGNPYINNQSQINTIYNLLDGFTIDSLKTGRIIGNPSIDAYDLIEIYDDSDINEPTIAKTLANCNFTYTGVMISEYTTEIGKEARKENLTKNSEATYKKYVQGQIDNVNAKFTMEVGEINDIVLGTPSYSVTTDTLYQPNTKYYTLGNDGEYTLLIEGTDYQVGSIITGTVYNVEYSNGISDVTDQKIDSKIESASTNISRTVLEQTSSQFQLLFENTGVQSTANEALSTANTAKEKTDKFDEYIIFEGARVTIGKTDSQSKLVITNDKISFMTGENESAYISNNQLYITDSTILNKLQIENWEIKPDAQHNLNTKWIGDN